MAWGWGHCGFSGEGQESAAGGTCALYLRSYGGFQRKAPRYLRSPRWALFLSRSRPKHPLQFCPSIFTQRTENEG